MKKFRIRVNDKVFDVEVEDVSGEATTVTAPASMPQPIAAPRAPAPAPVSSPKPVSPAPVPAAAPAPGPGGAGVVKSPLPGKVLKIVIEAMKMENEILAPRDCTVEEVLVEANQTVKTGDVLLKLA